MTSAAKADPKIRSGSDHRTAFFGLGTRMALASYFKAVLLLLVVLVLIAYSLDLARTFDQIRDSAQAEGQIFQLQLLKYLALRAVDFSTALLPVACFFGVFLAEILRVQRQETVIFSAAGYSPVQFLSAIVIFGLISGTVLMSLEGHFRKITTEMRLAMGVDPAIGKFRFGLSEKSYWFTSTTDAMRSRVLISEKPELRAVELFSGIDKVRLDSIILAEKGFPGEAQGTWRLVNAVRWTPDASGRSYKSSEHDELTVAFDLIPEQLTYLKRPLYMAPIPVLRKIAAMDSATKSAGAKVALQRIWAAFFLPGIFAFLGASFAQRGYSRLGWSLPLMFTFAFTGYLLTASIKLFHTLGIRGEVPAELAVTLPMLAVFLLSCFLLARRL